MRRPRPAVVALAAAALLAAPAAASGATARATAPASGGPARAGLTFTAAPGEANRLAVAPGPGTGFVRLHDDGAAVSPGPGCEAVDPNTVLCSPARTVAPGAPVDPRFGSVVVGLGDRADEARVEDGVAAVTLRGEAGGDTLRAGDSAATLDGGTGRDIVAGGAGDDVFAESDDRSPDDVDGGTGRDRLDYSGRRRRVSIDLGHGRGADRDRVRRVEDATGGRANDRLVGGSGPNALDGGPGNDTVLALGGTDQLLGGPGRDLLSGGSGRDTLDVSDAGRAQADRARCGKGTDVVSRPAAPDRLAKDCDWARLGGPASAVLVHQPLRAQRSGLVELRLSAPKTTRAFRGRLSLRFRGILLGRPTRQATLGPRGRATLRLSLVGPALTLLRELRRMTVEVVTSDGAFTTVLRAPLPTPSGTGGTPS